MKLDEVESRGEKSIREKRREIVKDIGKEVSRLDWYWKQAWTDYIKVQELVVRQVPEHTPAWSPHRLRSAYSSPVSIRMAIVVGTRSADMARKSYWENNCDTKAVGRTCLLSMMMDYVSFQDGLLMNVT